MTSASHCFPTASRSFIEPLPSSGRFFSHVTIFIYLFSEFNSQRKITKSVRTQNSNKRNKPKDKKQHIAEKLNHFRFFKFKRRFIKIAAIDLQTELATEAHLTERQ
jgi:hypothetical protein